MRNREIRQSLFLRFISMESDKNANLICGWEAGLWTSDAVFHCLHAHINSKIVGVRPIPRREAASVCICVVHTQWGQQMQCCGISFRRATTTLTIMPDAFIYSYTRTERTKLISPIYLLNKMNHLISTYILWEHSYSNTIFRCMYFESLNNFAIFARRIHFSHDKFIWYLNTSYWAICFFARQLQVNAGIANVCACVYKSVWMARYIHNLFGLSGLTESAHIRDTWAASQAARRACFGMHEQLHLCMGDRHAKQR